MKKLTFAGVFCAATILSASGTPNPAVGHDTITVLRGSAVEVVEVGRKGPTVLRGTGSSKAEPAGTQPVEVNVKGASPRIVGGENVWLYDRKSKRLVGCRFQFTSSVNSQFVRCTKRRL